jgi:N-acyl-D-aspartate/D-glutamate deacylase
VTAARGREGVVNPEDATHLMTELAVRRPGLLGPGGRAPGVTADLAMLNPATIADTRTVTEPNACATGVRDVPVRRSNGGAR